MIDQDLIFWPMIIQALVTLWMYVPMSRARVRTVKSGAASAADFRLPDRDEKPETRQLANALTNQFELPLLFFAVCLAAHAAGVVTFILMALACCFVVAKTLHSAIHMTTNRIRHRRPAFMAAYGACVLMWVSFATSLLSL